MKYVFIALVIILFLVIWSMWYEKEIIKKLIVRLKNEWGQVPDIEFNSDKLETLQAFYLSIKDDKLDVDDITWNDLDMDDIYMLMNNTQCTIGEEYLYALLRKPCFSKEELEERNRLIHFFESDEEKRLLLQTKLFPIGKLSNMSIYSYINRLDEQEPQSNLPHYLMVLSVFISIGIIFIKPGLGGVLTLVTVVNNIYHYYKRKASIDKFLIIFAYIVRLLDSINDISKVSIAEIQEYTKIMKEDYNSFRVFRKGSGMLTPKKVSGSIKDIFADYARMLFHVDLIKFNSMLRFLKENRSTLNRMYMNIGFLDSMIAAASFRELLPYYSIPELTKKNKPKLKVLDLYHPLLETPVSNSISEERSILITGSNASGKSTFIKTLAINAILSETIYTSISRSYVASYFLIFSSMALRDSIFRNESYYIVEIKSLKRILDHTNTEIPTLCFIDEVLRGTNTLERIAASSRILYSLSQLNTLVLAATHDIELTHILEKSYSNYHFQERIVDNKIIFDYQLYQGRAVSKNAIKLLGMLGYSKDIIQKAEHAAEEFLINGEWSNIN